MRKKQAIISALPPFITTWAFEAFFEDRKENVYSVNGHGGARGGISYFGTKKAIEETGFLYTPIKEVMTASAYTTWSITFEELVLRATNIKIFKQVMKEDFASKKITFLERKLDPVLYILKLF